MPTEDFKTKIEEGLKGLNRAERVAFAWRCGVRALPILGHRGNFDFWKKEDRQKHIYAVFYALDALLDPAHDAYSAAAAYSTNATSSAYCATILAHDAIAAKAVEAIFRAYAATYAIATISYAYVHDDDAYAAADAANAVAVKLDIDLESILLSDLNAIREERRGGNQSEPTDLYGEIWDRFQKALDAEGCGYWGRLYQNIFDQGLALDKDALTKRMNVPEEIRVHGAAAVGNFLEEINVGTMITQLTLRNFKSISEQRYDFTQFDLLVGRNNSGKSTVLQAMAIWQFCVDEFHRSKRTDSKGVQVVLPNFTALPVPEFNLLWKDRLPMDKEEQAEILISIDLQWKRASGETNSFGVELRYDSPQAIYAAPIGGWARFRECEQKNDLPRIAYVPPFSGLEPTEKWLDISPIRQQVGKGQPGGVLRNLLLKVSPQDWEELSKMIERWFSVKIQVPQYDSDKDVYIKVEYSHNKKEYDIISGGSGFHQVLTLLAFLYGYHPTTILLDEPDAHLHVNLQREILDYFKRKSMERNTQFLIATHAEEFVHGVDVGQIVSLLDQTPRRIKSAPNLLRAMAEVSNNEVAQLTLSPYILYVEGESDERILRAWADQSGAHAAMNKVCFKSMNGGSKKYMQDHAHEHFAALKQIIPHVSRLMIFDYDDKDTFHPDLDNASLAEWKRKNIENYLLVPDAWKRAAQKAIGLKESELILQKIDDFFSSQNLTLPPGKTWREVTANIFKVVDGKRILFEDDDALFHQLKNSSPSITLTREQVASNMAPDEIHKDVYDFIGKLVAMTQSVETTKG